MQNYSELVKIGQQALLWRFQVKLFRIGQDIYGNV